MDVTGLGTRASGLRFAVIAALAACSGNKSAPKAAREDARPQPVHPTDAAATVQPLSGKGDVQIRVEWKDVPVAARAVPGRTACGTARRAAVAPTTTWGIPEVFVAVDASDTTATRAPRITLADCTLSPRVAIASGALTIASAMTAPAALTIQHAGSLPLGEALAEDKARGVRHDILLPIAGHDVEVPTESGAIYKLAAGDEVAWIVATDQPFVGITEGGGSVVLRGVPAGTHAVTAWLPPRSGQSARVARGKVTVTPGALAEVTLDITKP